MLIDTKEIIDWFQNEINYCKEKRKKDPKFVRDNFVQFDKAYIEAFRWAIKHIKTLEKERIK